LKQFLLSALFFVSLSVLGQQKPIHLETGDSLSVEIFAKPFWNETNLEVKNGEKYSFCATDEWIDWYIITDANGYDMRHMNSFRSYRRSPDNKWFALMGSLDKSENLFLIGSRSEISFAKDGKLYCFANDVKGFYFNNKDSIRLKIKRLK
jgi:hypothetical protein